MPRVSKYSLPPQQLQELFQHFSSLVSSLHNQTHVEKFLDEFFTMEEKNMFAKRLALFIMLKQNLSPDMIQAKLNVSKETIRTYQQQFPLKSNMFHETIINLLRMDKVKAFFTTSSKALYTLVTAKSNMKSRAKIAFGKWK